MNRIKCIKQSKNILVFALMMIGILFTGCEKYIIESTEIDPNETRSFRTDIQPIFEKHKCSNCHPGVHSPDLSAANAYTSLKNGGFLTGTPPESAKLYKEFLTPHNGVILLDEEKQYLLYWISQGAKNN
jgi:hypothetical protein